MCRFYYRALLILIISCFLSIEVSCQDVKIWEEVQTPINADNEMSNFLPKVI